MSEESEKFLKGLVDSAANITPHEMVEKFEDAVAAISAGRGNIAWKDGQPVGGSIWQPKIRWHADSRCAHVFIDVSGLTQDGITIEARSRGLSLIFQRTKEIIHSNGEFHSHQESSQRIIDLGIEINADTVEAIVEGGIMHIRCPRDSSGVKVVDINWQGDS